MSSSTISGNLISPPRWYFSDLVGNPLSAGTMETRSSLDHAVFKTVYKDPGLTIQWPNIIEFDINGMQGPFYFAFDTSAPLDTYFLVVRDKNGVEVFSIDNYFPSNFSQGGGIIGQGATLKNYIVNNTYFRNVGQTAVNIPAGYTKLAGGAHERIRYPDISINKNNATATDQIIFQSFPQGDTSLFPDYTPEYYLNYICSNTPSGETFKYVVHPISYSVRNFDNTQVTCSIWAKGDSGTQTLQIYAYQNFGTKSDGTMTEVITQVGPNPINLSNTWTRYTFTFFFPSSEGNIIQATQDDFVGLLISLPLGAQCNVSFTKPSLYLGNLAPQTDFDSYDSQASIFNSPRTGFVQSTFAISPAGFLSQYLPPPGWLKMNDGTIGSATSNATARANADTWPLFEILWHNFITDIPTFSAAGLPVSRGASAAADWYSNVQVALPATLNRVLANENSASAKLREFFTVAGNNLVVLNTSKFMLGQLVQFGNIGGALPTPLSPATNYYITPTSQTSYGVSTTSLNAANGVFITLTSAGSGNSYFLADISGSIAPGIVGQSFHQPTLGELFPHNHDVPGVAGGSLGAGSNGPYILNVSDPQGTFDLATNYLQSAGGGSSFNVIQPTTYTVFIIKL